MKVFITGANGFLASHLTDALQAKGHEVRGCDINCADVLPGHDVIHGDCRNLDRMTKWLKGFDVVVHTGALPHEGLSVFSPLTIGDSIYRGSVSTFSAAISAGVRRIVNCSSMSRYGAISAPFSETDVPVPVDPYGIAKLAAERTLEALARVHDFEYVTAVPHNIYGPRQCRTDPYRNVIAIMMNRIMHGHPPIIYGDGHQRRCFSYIDDVTPCLVQMVTTDETQVLDRVINIGPDQGDVNILQLAHMVGNAMGHKGAPIHYDGRPAEVHTATCSSALARDLLGFRQMTSLKNGLDKMAEWMRNVGPAPFNYKLPIEIMSEKTPRTWSHKEI